MCVCLLRISCACFVIRSCRGLVTVRDSLFNPFKHSGNSTYRLLKLSRISFCPEDVSYVFCVIHATNCDDLYGPCWATGDLEFDSR